MYKWLELLQIILKYAIAFYWNQIFQSKWNITHNAKSEPETENKTTAAHAILVG